MTRNILQYVNPNYDYYWQSYTYNLCMRLVKCYTFRIYVYLHNDKII